MSASSKKQLRKEQAAAQQANKQRAQQKESKKMKLYTGIFFAILAVLLLIVVFAAIDNSGIVERNTTALEIGSESVSAAEMNMYYIEAINEFVEANSNYLTMYGLDITLPLDQQKSADGTSSWADYFIELAKEDIQANYAIYNAAKDAGYTLSEEDVAALDEIMAALDETAAENNLSTKAYLEALYGLGANVDDYRHAMEVMAVASAYYADYSNSLTYTDDEIAAEDAADPNAYTMYSYNYVLLYTSDYLEGGTEDGEGNITYSDEENAAALAACEAEAKSLASGTYATAADLDAAIAALPDTVDRTYTASTANDDKVGTSVITLINDWMTDPARQPGDVTYVPRATTNDDGTQEISGYSVYYFRSSSDNNYPLANVRHILVQFEGGTVNSSTGETTYSTVEIAAAKTAAQAIYDEWLAGEATEDSFAALANEKSEDPGSNTNGGLYDNVYPGEMVEAFNDWCFDEARQPGDHTMIQTSYGFHIMFYSGDSETTYREHLVTSTLASADLTEWNTAILEKYPVTDKNLSRVNRDLVLYNAYYG